MYPKKRFGQNFLTNKNIANRIIKALEISDSDTIIEIGPGTGILTEILNNIKCKNKIAVEIDHDLVSQIKSRFDQVEIIQQDILSFSFINQFKQSKNKLKIVGNIPYNITSPILFHLLQNSSSISEAVLMMQKELADRLTAKKNTKSYGILTILLNAQAKIDRLFLVKRENFYPKPTVNSAVVKIKFLKTDDEIENYDLFKTIVKTTFNNRRKMLINSLNKIVDKEKLKNLKSVSLNYRPENLSVNEFIELTKEIILLK